MTVMPASTDAWIAAQSPDVRAELANLIDYRPEPEFIDLLSELLPVVPCSGLVDLYYDIWYCIPSRLALTIAVKHGLCTKGIGAVPGARRAGVGGCCGD